MSNDWISTEAYVQELAKTVLKRILIVAYLAMVIWPGWQAELQAADMQEIECRDRGNHIDEFGYCVGPNADTPPSNEDLKQGQIWVYRGNGNWVTECVEPVGECKGDTYEVEIGDDVIPIESTDLEVNGVAISNTEPPPSSSIGSSSSSEPPSPSESEPSSSSEPSLPTCARSAYQQQLATYSTSSPPPCEYFVYMRRFASPESFGGGFVGDNRQASTSLDVTSRISGSFVLGSDGGGSLLNVCSDPTGFIPTGGTATGAPMGTLINGNSLVDRTPLIIFTTAGSNPLIPGSPDIDTRLDLQASEGFESITFSGTLTGDPFPSAEVFIADTQGNSVMLTSFETPINPSIGSAIGLPGQQNMRLGNFEKTIQKGEGGLCRRWPL